MPRKSARKAAHWKNPDDGMVVNYKRRIRRNKRRRRLTLFVLMLAMLAGIVFFAPFFKIARIDIIGAGEKTGIDVQMVCDTLVGKNINFYSTENISATLEQFPHVKSAQVSRHFPNILRVNIQESVPFVKCQLADGNWFVVNDDGQILEITSEEPSTIATLIGVDEMPFLMGVPFTADNALLHNYTQVAQRIVNNGLVESIKWVDVSDSSGIIFQFEGITVMIGNSDKIDYKFSMFEGILKELPTKVKGTLDLRDGSQAYFREIF